MASHMRPTASHRRPRSRRATLGLAVVAAALVMGLANVAVRALHDDGHGKFRLALPSVVLASGGQSANRIALDTSQLHTGKDVVVPVDVTNAGNQTINGVTATLASQTPGVQLAVDTARDPAQSPVAPGTTVQYRLRLHATPSLAAHPKQVVVAISPTSSPTATA